MLFGVSKVEYFNGEPSSELVENDVRIQLSDNSVIVLIDASHLFDEQETQNGLGMNDVTGGLTAQNLSRFDFRGENDPACQISCPEPEDFDAPPPPDIWPIVG